MVQEAQVKRQIIFRYDEVLLSFKVLMQFKNDS